MKSSAIQEKEEELELHRQLLDEAKHKHEETFEELTAELSNLRTSVNFEKKTSFVADENLKVMHEMAAEFEIKEEEYQMSIDQLERQLNEIAQEKKSVERGLLEENRMIKKEIVEFQATVSTLTSERKSH